MENVTKRLFCGILCGKRGDRTNSAYDTMPYKNTENVLKISLKIILREREKMGEGGEKGEQQSPV